MRTCRYTLQLKVCEKQFSDVQEMHWPKASEIEVPCGWFASQELAHCTSQLACRLIQQTYRSLKNKE